MNIFNDQFKNGGPKDDAVRIKIGTMMEEKKYWRIIEKSIQRTHNQDEQKKFLIGQLIGLSPFDIVGFQLRTDKLMYDAYTAEMWCAGQIMNGYCSDDGFHYFRCWLIAQGKATYQKAIAHPDTLATKLNPKIEFYDFESFGYVPNYAFRAKTGMGITGFTVDDFPYNDWNHPRLQLNWSGNDPMSMRQICPNLYKAKLLLNHNRRYGIDRPGGTSRRIR